MTMLPDKTKLESEHKHARPLTNCVWDPLSRFVYFGAEDNAVHRLDVSTKAITAFPAHDSWVRAIGASNDGKLLFTGGYDGRLAIWPTDAAEPKPLTIIDAHRGWIRALAVSPNGETVVTCGNDKQVKRWNTNDLSLAGELSGHASHVYNVGFSQDGSQLMSCDLQGVIKLWPMSPASASNAAEPGAALKQTGGADIVTAAALAKYDTVFRADIGGARALSFSTDGKILALAGITNVTNAFAGIGEVVVVLVDWQDKKIAKQLECKDKQRGTIWGVANHRDGYWIGACGGSGGFLIFWKNDSAQDVFKLKLKNDARGMSLSPDGTKIAIAHADSYLRFYSLNS